MKARHIYHIVTTLVFLMLTQACAAIHSTNEKEFLASLTGTLVFERSSSKGNVVQAINFDQEKEHLTQIYGSEQGILSLDGEWRLLLVKESDTNDDGTINWQDRSSVYLAHQKSSERKRSPLAFSVGTCGWTTGHMTAACSFVVSDVVRENTKAGISNNSVIYLVNLESGELLRRLSDLTRTSWQPKCSPDGTMVAFQSGTKMEKRMKHKRIQVVNVKNGDLIYEFADESIGDLAWSPDSTRIAFDASLQSGEYSKSIIKGMYRDIFYVDVKDGNPIVTNVTQTSRFTQVPATLTAQGGIWVFNPVWSSSGETIASVWETDRGEAIWLTSVDGDEWTKLTDGANHQYFLIEWRP
jgi:hypothetical protein